MASLESDVRRVLDLIVPKIHDLQQTTSRPIILGITGLQGSGKSTWASKIVNLLTLDHKIRAITVSLDDFYQTHDGLISRREKDLSNKLYRTRGQPGTHDEQVAKEFLEAVASWDGSGELKIPSFDKSQFQGEGDRAPESEWPRVEGKVDVVVFEGWCVGFRSLLPETVGAKHRAARTATETSNDGESITTLADHELSHLYEVNTSLQRYNETFMGPQHFDFMIHIDTADLRNVYHWRLQQEHAMIKVKGSGMTDDQVRSFVRGYMPGYELYLDGLREGFFEKGSGRQIRVVLGRGRGVESVDVL
ncbi:P-loop containing nucleoside triphosphate hydrolase protein [Dendryphion nanum]|uniref:P-loop containing nucleoside triphosphate hydrolase protein n=1 Tax=Dendryphion nanum TaxID=256645 RepID=A0A9P9IK59_9PLEO|nr:P-loop containing nucleoside triphosphate hydrolase protein [Dendryphion nanum]